MHIDAWSRGEGSARDTSLPVRPFFMGDWPAAPGHLFAGCASCRKDAEMERTNAIINDINGAANHGKTPVITEKTTLGELLGILGNTKRLEKTPTVKMLREEAGDPVAVEERTKVYANGYAAYDNGYARTVVWLPYCKSFTYYFNPLKDTEKGYGIEETFSLPEGYLESQPWPIAVTLIAEHRIESNVMNRSGSRTGTRDYESEVFGDKNGDAEKAVADSYEKEYDWREDRVGEDPLTIVIRNESRREMLESMTDKQREVFVLYYQYGYYQREIAEMLGITQKAVDYRLEGAIGHVNKFFKKK